MQSFERTEFAKTMQKIAHTHGLWDVWSDWLLMAATSIANAVDKREDVWREREDKYLNTVKRYTKDQVSDMAKLLGMLTDELMEPRDFLGQTFMALELGNKWLGQFFTPDALCNVMARLVYGDEIKKQVDR